MNKYVEMFGKPYEMVSIIDELKLMTSFKAIYLRKDIAKLAASVADTMQGVTSTQMRRFYGYTKGIEQANRHRNKTDDIEQPYKLQLLLPRIAGSSEREKLLDLYRFIEACVNGNKIKDVEDLRAFVDFFEAVLDYQATNKKENK